MWRRSASFGSTAGVASPDTSAGRHGPRRCGGDLTGTSLHCDATNPHRRNSTVRERWRAATTSYVAWRTLAGNSLLH